jgi:hypothetical protein
VNEDERELEDPLLEAAVARERLPGDLSRVEIRELLEGLNIPRAAELQKAFTDAGDEVRVAYEAFVARHAPAGGDPLIRVCAWPPDPEIRVRRDDAMARFAAVLLHGHAFWFVHGWLVEREGRAVIEQLVIESELESQRGIRLDLLRALSLSRLSARVIAQLRAEPEWIELLERAGLAVVSEADRRRAKEAAARAAKQPLRRRGRAGYPDEHYRRIALRYIELVQEHGSKGVLVRIAEEESRRRGYRVAHATVRDWVRGARERGFLAPGERGRATPLPGPRLYEVEA